LPEVFDRYAHYYDLIYSDKDYEKECDFLEQVFRKYTSRPVRTVFEGGCGTGGHALCLARRGYEVLGVDASEVMISKAIEKGMKGGLEVSFQVGDLRALRLGRRFDAAISMFAVMDYFVSNHDLATVLRNIRNVLERSALFVFDAWNGLAVMRLLPEARVKVVEGGGKRLIRTVVPELDPLHHVCRSNYHVLVTQGRALVDDFEETHVVRYFFPQEIAHYLDDAGFELLEFCPFMRLGEKLDEKEWNFAAIARARE